MGKTFISANNVDAYICKADQALYADNTMVLTPGAKDCLKSKGISIIYGPRPNGGVDAVDGDTQALESLVARITSLLKNEYKITDAGTLAAVVTRVVKKIKTA
ncbi:MAG: hypothetical protein MI747_22065 [Desulfobacterales bacterium]|nr:hypothetical protein [Desulfobacterales bacterium]